MKVLLQKNILSLGKIGDLVEISAPGLGTLRNTVRLSTECSEWVFATSHLMRNLAARQLI